MQTTSVPGRPDRDAEAANAGDRDGAVGGDERRQQLASHRGAAHAGHDHGRREAQLRTGLGAPPLALAQLLGHAGDGVGHARRIGLERHHTGSPEIPTTRLSTLMPSTTSAPARTTDPRTRAPAPIRHDGTDHGALDGGGRVDLGGGVDEPPGGIRSRFAAR